MHASRIQLEQISFSANSLRLSNEFATYIWRIMHITTFYRMFAEIRYIRILLYCMDVFCVSVFCLPIAALKYLLSYATVKFYIYSMA
jgi:hypothetical protein